MLVYGTRPEAIKLAPLVRALQHDERFEPVVVVTGQHREMLDQVNDFFGIVPDADLDIHRPGQSLTQITVGTLEGAERVIEQFSPSLLVVQGDTTSAFAAGLAGFYHQVPVAHVEAGLRTGSIASPYPEEANRRLLTQIASLHLCPTALARDNLLQENTDPADIVVTGNTVIDALLDAVARPVAFTDTALADATADTTRRVVLVTAHRRESWGRPMQAIGRAVARVACAHPDDLIVLPAHRNPEVRAAILPHIEGLDNVVVTEPLEYGQFCALMNRAHLVLTDSGGVQEEAPALSKPVLVMRENTERPEAVDFGVARLVGTDEETIVDAVGTLLDDADAHARMANAANPYGDGRACFRIIAAMAALTGVGKRVPEFTPERNDSITKEK
ncbi:non-hydrolyzing UDP-N-acetylglucosamine 2-epimerase [Actinomyces ruminis]|uniref:UDP-N-acetylglucosamine 2-epimerase (non-hydrolyzing) n=1 Tax=Actinomyces ruminis TaxID=1937003 RepID=A0ABX4M9U4_9ACTO|nr:UDP-N-acetylglucosamine 2-epimerase (non-hydrolyzing) [Actinomyces ruminis]PHP52227.1 UDP-N-acetylglucosamine 2-epimerase (non-hydrolyzing) [Actinomyces ruminis]